MTEVVCNNCGKKYIIDLSRIKGRAARMKCKECDNTIIVSKPTEASPENAPSPLPDSDPPPEAAAIPAGAAVERAAAADETRKIRFGLVGKVITAMLIVGLLPFGIFWGLAARETADRIRKDNQQLLAVTAQGLNWQVNEWVDKNVRILQTAARLPQIVGMNREVQEPVLKNIQKSYPWMYLVFTVDPQGMNVARNDGKALRDYSDRSYYAQVMAGKELAWQNLIGKTSKQPALVLAVPINDGGVTVGVLAAAMTTDEISQHVASWKKGNTGFAFLVDENGKVVAHQNKRLVETETVLADHPLVASFQKQKRPLSMFFQKKNGHSTLGYIIGNRYGWALAVEQESDEVFESLQRVQYYATILAALTVLVVLLVSWIGGRALVRPIRELTRVAERMSLGELDIEIDVRSKDEIGMLARAIGRMQTSLRMAMQRLRRRR